jgi:hypothetical protein
MMEAHRKPRLRWGAQQREALRRVDRKPRRARATPRGAGRPGRPGPSWYGHGDLAASLVLVFPLLLLYEVGVLFAGSVNGADVVTRLLFAALGRPAYLALHALIAAGFLLWLRRGRRWATLRLEVAAPLILEAALYALAIGAAISMVLDRVLGLGVSGGSVIAALGAGVHEELVFRLALLGGLVALFEGSPHLAGRPRAAVALAFVVSSLAFAAAHHLGAHGEPWTAHAVLFRVLAGAAFGAIFWFRSLAHAVYAHAIYDLLVYWRA